MPGPRVRWHQTRWWRLAGGLLFLLILFSTTIGDKVVDDIDYTSRWKPTAFTGIDGVCAVTTLRGNLDGQAKRFIGWRSTNLFPETATATIIDCHSGRPVVVDALRLDQTWTDPTCSTAPDVGSYARQYSPIRGDYPQAAR